MRLCSIVICSWLTSEGLGPSMHMLKLLTDPEVKSRPRAAVEIIPVSRGQPLSAKAPQWDPSECILTLPFSKSNLPKNEKACETSSATAIYGPRTRDLQIIDIKSSSPKENVSCFRARGLSMQDRILIYMVNMFRDLRWRLVFVRSGRHLSPANVPYRAQGRWHWLCERRAHIQQFQR